jgi:lipopolysaccharide biosynthesis glycosyltransferase
MTASSNNPLILVCAADDNYAMQIAITIRSVLENLGSDRKVVQYIIDGGIKEHNKRKILQAIDPERCHVNWLSNPDALIAKVEGLNNLHLGDSSAAAHLTIATYYRILIPELLPHQYQKVIYLDCDLVINGDLGKLWDIEMGDNYLLAVQDQAAPYVSSAAGLMNYQALGIAADAKYFNAGVLVINLEKWRSERIDSQLLEYLKNYQDFIRWHDQDALNGVLAGKWGELDPRWNQMPQIYSYSSWQDSPFSETTYNNIVRDPYIIHFSSSSKPWNSREKHPYMHLFFKYLDLTPWSGWRFTIWRRLWRRLFREIKQFKKLFSQPKTTRSPLKAS